MYFFIGYCRKLLHILSVAVCRKALTVLGNSKTSRGLYSGLYLSVTVNKIPIHFSSGADPDPGSGAFLTPGSGLGKKSRSGSGMNIPDLISESLETIFWVKNT
jgi:hypothetical protein